MTTFDAVDLFAGPGGWDEAARRMGLRVIGLEMDAAACQTRAAAGHSTVRCDVSQYPTAPFAGVRGQAHSPVCTPFSQAGRRAGIRDLEHVYQAAADLAAGNDTRDRHAAACDDPKSILAAEPMRWLHDLRPEWVVMEQVPDVLPLWKLYVKVLRSWGYSAQCGILNVADYGLPTTRRRAVVAASRVRDVMLPAATHSERHHDADLFGESRLPWVSMADALDLPSGMRINTRGNRRTSGGNEFSADGPAWGLTEKARSWWVLRQGKRSNATVRRLDQPAGTLVTGHARRDYEWVKVDGTGDLEKRPLLLTEAAVLQGFHADYPFRGSESRRFLQIANAVPPLLAAHVLAAATGVELPAAQLGVAA